MYNTIVGGLINRGEYSTFSPIPTKLTGAEVLSMRICKIDKCNSIHFGLGFCQKHYVRFKKYGSPYLLGGTRRLQESHNLTKSPEYKTWERIKRRCYNKSDLSYKYYGAKGITVCDRWLHSFNNFYGDMGKKPFSKAQIDRKKGEESYNPDNCRWVTQLENLRNKKSTILNMEYAAKIRDLHKSGLFTLKQLSLIYKVSSTAISRLIKNKTWRMNNASVFER